ncbi:MAG: MoxR family ATPase [Cyclobacteriaceae bacterium]|nr:MoxR family ATPase [Cyclobacteriaceae bacterium]
MSSSTEDMTTTFTEAEGEAIQDKIINLRTEIGKVIIGQRVVVDQMLASLFAGGHVLLEGVPGLAKTLMVRTLAEATSLTFKRIQFTPDLMPSDIIGTEILQDNQSTGKHEFRFIKGPVFTNILLADEINRTPPKTQSALLEAMQEYEVTYAGNLYLLDKPFFILATQNPIEQTGTFPLPEAQLDRFMMYIRLEYPSEQEELQVLNSTTGAAVQSVNPVISGADVMRIQQLVRQVHINEALLSYINTLVRETRPENATWDFIKEQVQWGAGPRCGQSLVLAAKAFAFLDGRFAVVPDDISKVVKPVMRHRILLSFKAEAEHLSSDEVIDQLLNVVSLPKANW